MGVGGRLNCTPPKATGGGGAPNGLGGGGELIGGAPKPKAAGGTAGGAPNAPGCATGAPKLGGVTGAAAGPDTRAGGALMEGAEINSSPKSLFRRPVLLRGMGSTGAATLTSTAQGSE